MATLAQVLVVWDVDGTLIPADLRWLRRAISRTYGIDEADIRFPDKKVHGYTDESIVIDTAVSSGVAPEDAERGIDRFKQEIMEALRSGHAELVKDQSPYPGAAETIQALHTAGATQTVLTGNLRDSAEYKLRATGLDHHMDLDIGGYGSDARDRLQLPRTVAERFAKRYGKALDPSLTVLIGDAPNDIACARSAGFQAIAVAHRASREELTAHGPDAVVDRLAALEIRDLIQALTRPST